MSDLEKGPAECDCCCDRPSTVLLEWPGKLGLGLCVPCAHYIAKRGVILYGDSTREDEHFSKPGRWVWETTKVLS